MQAQQAILTFSEAELPLGDRLLKLAFEIDRTEGYADPHAVLIARLAERVGAMMGLHGSDLTSLKFAALTHDIGERQTKRNYLLRPDALTWEETLDLWRHPILGEQVSAELRLPRHAQLIIRWHHEMWNGLGYPDGLAGEAIPLGARILRAVDTYYALISQRPHRERFEVLDAEQIIADLAGIELDPIVVKYLLTALVEERKNCEAEFTPAITQVTDVLSVDIVDQGAAPFVAFNEPANDLSISISGDDASMGEDPLEVAPPTVPILATSNDEIAEPLSELLAEIPERPAESSFYPPAADWVGPFPPQTSPEYVPRQTAELIPIDPEQPLAETAAERSPQTSTKTDATEAAEEPAGFPGRDDRNEY